MSFQHPLALVALLAVPVLVGLWLWNDRRRSVDAARFSSLALLPNLVTQRPGRLRYIPLGLLLLAFVALVLGMSRPHAKITVPRKDATVVLAIDISRSMTATDVAPTRLDAARNAAYAFLAKVPKTYNVGVVAFGSRAFVAIPPTLDRPLVAQAINDLQPGQGTAIGDAVRISAQLGRTEKAVEGVVPPSSVLLISDGAPDGGRVTAKAGAERAKALHVPVSTVLVGTQNGVVNVTLTGGYTEQLRVPPSPGTLQLIADTTGGQFFRARTSSELDQVYRRLATRVGHRTENREITDAFAGGAIVLLLAGGGLSAFWFRRIV